VIVLHQFARVWGIPNLSPFCSKVETYLRMTGLPYEVVDSIPIRAPRRKLPYIRDGDEVVSDSRLILEYLADRYEADLDRDLSPSDHAVSLAFQRTIEDDLHWAVMHSRWSQASNWPANKQAIFGPIPPLLRDLVAAYARKQMQREVWEQGMGRRSESEIFRLGAQDLTALSDFLADKPFFMGEEPTRLDASAFGLLSNILWCPTESPLKEHAGRCGNLASFCERIRSRYFEDSSEG
jgi:glutathione S-transferase